MKKELPSTNGGTSNQSSVATDDPACPRILYWGSGSPPGMLLLVFNLLKPGEYDYI